MAAVRVCLAYVAACIVVGFVWMIVAMVTSNGADFAEAMTMWGLIVALVGAVGFLPFVILRSVMWLSNKESLILAALLGAAMGAVLFALVFGHWFGSSDPSEIITMVAGGAGLGGIAGAVYWRIEVLLWKIWPDTSDELV